MRLLELGNRGREGPRTSSGKIDYLAMGNIHCPGCIIQALLCSLVAGSSAPLVAQLVVRQLPRPQGIQNASNAWCCCRKVSTLYRLVQGFLFYIYRLVFSML